MKQILIGAASVIAMAGFILFYDQYKECKQSGGILVRTPFTYECINR